MSASLHTKCRFCEVKLPTAFLDLGLQPPANNLCVTDKHTDEDELYPLKVTRCSECGLAQLTHIVEPKTMFSHYLYTPSETGLSFAHFDGLAKSLTEEFEKPGTVIDVGCLPFGEVITENYIPKDISSINIEDKVLSRDGSFRCVKKTFSRDFNGELVVLKLFGGRCIKLTPNHPVLVVDKTNEPNFNTLSYKVLTVLQCLKGPVTYNDIENSLRDQKLKKYVLRSVLSYLIKRNCIVQRGIEYYSVVKPTEHWLAASDLNISHCVVLPILSVIERYVGALDLLNFLPGYVEYNNKLFATQTNKGKNKVVKAYNQRAVPRYVALDYDMGCLLGYYVAEGSTNGKYCGAGSFAFNAKEHEYIQNVRVLLKRKLSLPSTLKKQRSTTSVVCNSVTFKRLFSALCGGSAHTKHIPNCIWSASVSAKRGFIRGSFAGDGSFRIKGQHRRYKRHVRVKKTCVSYGTVSKELAYQYKFLLAQFNISTILEVLKPSGYGSNNGKPLWRLTISDFLSRSILHKIVYGTELVASKRGKAAKTQRGDTALYLPITAVYSETYNGKVYNIETESNDYVVETAIVHNSNNGFILERFKTRGWTPVGVEPAKNLSEQSNKNDTFTINDFWGHRASSMILDKFDQVDLVTAINVFAHVIDNHDFVKNVKRVLKPNGLFVIEVPSFLTMLRDGTFDLIYFEHFSFLRAIDIVNFLENNDFEVIKIEDVNSHGGSLRVFAQHKNGPRSEVSIRDRLLEEYQIISPDLISEFVRRVKYFREVFTKTVKESKGLVVGYGAPAKATVLTTFCGLGREYIKYIVDDNPLKHNKFIPGSHIPVVNPTRLKEVPPDFVIVFPWNVKDDIVSKLPEGVKKIIPMPVVKVI